jgi:ribosomal protein S18 acetylase RimI-like enzyme
MTTNIIIRKATLKDIKKVREIANVPGLQISGEECAPSEKWYKGFIKFKQMFYVAESNGQVIGFLTGDIIRDFGYVWESGVLPEFRSRGIGSLLLEKFVDECEKKKLRFVVCYGHANEKTLNFFRKHKFIEGGTYKELRLDLKNF